MSAKVIGGHAAELAHIFMINAANIGEAIAWLHGTSGEYVLQ
jgi:hypothetical protein